MCDSESAADPTENNPEDSGSRASYCTSGSVGWTNRQVSVGSVMDWTGTRSREQHAQYR